MVNKLVTIHEHLPAMSENSISKVRQIETMNAQLDPSNGYRNIPRSARTRRAISSVPRPIHRTPCVFLLFDR